MTSYPGAARGCFVDVPGCLPGITDRDRRLAARIYGVAWGKNRSGGPWDAPVGAVVVPVRSARGTIRAWHLPGKKGRGTVVLAHPDRRYGGHWFVREGWVEVLHEAGFGCLWFDQPNYGQGTAGSPFLAENVGAALWAAKELDDGPLQCIGVSLGSFAAALAAPNVPQLAGLVLESPYPTFTSWYEGKGHSLDRWALAAFALLFRRAMKALDARASLARFSAPLMVSWSDVDKVTPALLSKQVADARSDTVAVKVAGAPHLRLWDDSAYRARVLDFLRSNQVPF